MPILTKEHYEIALKNGICKGTLQNRVYNCGWDIDKAITKPIQKQLSLWRQYKDISVVSRCTFYERVKGGLTPLEAATIPPIPQNKRSFKRVFTKEVLEIAKSNGISRKTVEARLYLLKWSLEKAITQPVDLNKSRYRKKVPKY